MQPVLKQCLLDDALKANTHSSSGLCVQNPKHLLSASIAAYLVVVTYLTAGPESLLNFLCEPRTDPAPTPAGVPWNNTILLRIPSFLPHLCGKVLHIKVFRLQRGSALLRQSSGVFSLPIRLWEGGGSRPRNFGLSRKHNDTLRKARSTSDLWYFIAPTETQRANKDMGKYGDRRPSLAGQTQPKR